MPASTSIFTLDGQVCFPASELLAVARMCVRALHAHYATQQRANESAGDEEAAIEAAECLQDVEHTVHAIDPEFRQELLSQRLELKDTPAIQPHDGMTELKTLLTISRMPKAFWVIPWAAKIRRETRPADASKEEVQHEDVLLDLLVFLAEKRERAGLFKTIDGEGSG
ncbi:hypothetical protein OF83DRAFT_1176703 [Amylostereum chailletii]|nr:hypothetical protein OF83DRAFT_1176703 [Amylostereum chailletii]